MFYAEKQVNTWWLHDKQIYTQAIIDECKQLKMFISVMPRVVDQLRALTNPRHYLGGGREREKNLNTTLSVNRSVVVVAEIIHSF
jgi:hypothetical protein